MSKLEEMDRAAKALAVAREELGAIVEQINEGVQSVQRRHMRSLKAAVNRAAERHDALLALVREAPDQFVKPRSLVMHGQKFGFRKGSGSVEFEDAETVARLAQQHFPEQFDVLVQTVHKPIKTALAQLTVLDLKKLGCTVEDSDDVAFIKATDSAVDKLVGQLLKAATEEVEA